MTTDILILGGSGFIGARAAQTAHLAGLTCAGTYRTHPLPPGIQGFALDLNDRKALSACLEDCQPKVVTHCAVTYDLSEAAQMQISAASVRVLLSALQETGLNPRLIYVSTNAVFSGRDGPYTENDLPDPHNRTDSYHFYGLARRTGEQIALDEWADTIIVRTANVDGYDAWGTLNPRFERLIGPLRAGKSLSRYVDRTISPTLVGNLAQGLIEVAQPDFATRQTLHIAGCEPMTDYFYAQNIARRMGVPESVIQPDHYLPENSHEQYNIGLDVRYTQSLLKTKLLNVSEMLERIFNKV